MALIIPWVVRAAGGGVASLADIKAPIVIAGSGSTFERTGASYPTQLVVEAASSITDNGQEGFSGGPTFPITVKFFEAGAWSDFSDTPLSWVTPVYDPDQNTNGLVCYFNVISDPGFDSAGYFIDVVAQDGAGNYDYAQTFITITSS